MAMIGASAGGRRECQNQSSSAGKALAGVDCADFLACQPRAINSPAKIKHAHASVTAVARWISTRRLAVGPVGTLRRSVASVLSIAALAKTGIYAPGGNS